MLTFLRIIIQKKISKTFLHRQKCFSIEKWYVILIWLNESFHYDCRPIAISTYHTFVLQWLEVFPREQILIVNGDRLIEDPVSEVQKIESFLGLESKIKKENFYFNQTKGFYCLKANSSVRCLHESKGRKHPRVNSSVVSKLRKYFNDHNQKLYDLIGEDLGWPEE